MDIQKTLQSIKDKYNLDIDLFYYNKEKDISYYLLAKSIIEETEFLNTFISRIKKGLPSYSVQACLPLHHWDLFQDLVNHYSFQFTGKLEYILMLAAFLDRYFYVDGSWVKTDALLLKELIADKDLNELLKYYLDKDCEQVLRESSYYYADDVWAEVKEYFLDNPNL